MGWPKPFAAALASWTPERAKATDALLAGQSIPAIEQLMTDKQLTAVDLVTYYADRVGEPRRGRKCSC